MLLSKLKGVFGVEFKLCKGDRKLPKVTAHQNWPELLKIQLPGYYRKTGQIRASGSRGKESIYFLHSDAKTQPCLKPRGLDEF